MKTPSCIKQIRDRILSSPKDSVFVLSDFSGIADSDNVRQTVSRLKKEGLLQPVLRGVYVKATENAAPDAVAHAIARNFGWTIVPHGDIALNILGISKTKPKIWAYVSNGMYKEYSFGDVTVKFKRTTNRFISNISYKTALIIQALKTLGKGRVKSGEIEAIKGSLTDDEREALLSEAQCASSWIYDLVKKICGK